MYDAAIVGAGPAGCTAAHALARAGAAVVLLERERLPRYKTCGGGLVLRARRWLPVDVGAAVERECYSAEVNVLDAGVHLVVEREAPMISTTMRDVLDGLLACAAQEAGAEVRAGCEVLDVRQVADRVELQTPAGTVAARFAVAADGALSRLARAAGWRDDRVLIPALESELRVSDGTFARFSGSARFDIDVLPHGYGWVFPKRAHLSVGVANFKPGRVQLPALLRRYLERLGLDEVEGEERHGFVIPVTPRRDGFVRGRVLLVGDAAGFADPVTGEGISFAALSGQIAAEALWEARFAPEAAEARYHARLAATILEEVRLGRRIAQLLYIPRWLRAQVMRVWGQRLAERLTEVFLGERSYREMLRDRSLYLGRFPTR